jgi:hypothetical protein
MAKVSYAHRLTDLAAADPGRPAITCGDERDAERDSLVHAHELLVGGRVAALGARDERLLVGWPAPHSAPSTPGAPPGFL